MMTHPSPVGEHHAALPVDRRSHQHIDPHLPSQDHLRPETLVVPVSPALSSIISGTFLSYLSGSNLFFITKKLCYFPYSLIVKEKNNFISGKDMN